MFTKFVKNLPTVGAEMASLLDTKIYITVILLAAFTPMALWQKNQKAMPEKIPFDVAMIRSGDLVFRKGRGIFSDIFKNIGDADSPFSHVGIVYVEREDVFVIHTEANEVTGVGFAKKEQLSDFISIRNALTYEFYRVDDLDNTSTKSVLESALKYVDEQIPFDTEFDLTDNDRLYCTELVYKAYRTAGINLVGKPSRIQVPSFNGMKELEAIPIGQLLKSSAIRLNPTKIGRLE